MRTARSVGMLALALLIVGPALAAERKAPAKAEPPCPADQRITRWLEGITLTDAQQAKLAELKKEYGPKLMEATKKMPELTEEQKKARAEAYKAAKEAGKTGQEAREAVTAAVKLTDEQKAQEAEARKLMAPLEKELREKTMAVLTPEQQEQLKKKLSEGRKKPGT